jgi:hypothetical protein
MRHCYAVSGASFFENGLKRGSNLGIFIFLPTCRQLRENYCLFSSKSVTILHVTRVQWFTLSPTNNHFAGLSAIQKSRLERASLQGDFEQLMLISPALGAQECIYTGRIVLIINTTKPKQIIPQHCHLLSAYAR